MKRRKAIVSLLLATTLTAGILAGCGKNDGAQSSGPAAESGETAENAEDYTLTLPLVDEPTTLSIFMPMNETYSIYSKNWSDSEFFKEMEKRTGVSIEFITPSMGDEVNAFNLMIASGQLPDIITWAGTYSEGAAAAIDDEYFLDLTPYLDTYLKDYNKVRTASDKVKKDTTLDDGRIAGIYEIRTGTEGPWCGYQVRKDWLDDLGIDTPVTFDDWEVMLTKFKEEKGAYAPLSLPGTGYDFYSTFSSGFGAASGYINQDGKAVYGPAQDSWRDFLSTANDWYAKGLIDPDFMTASPYFVDMEMISSEQSGAWYGINTITSAYKAAAPGSDIVAVPNPVKKAGDVTHTRCGDSVATTDQFTAICATSDKKELAMKWLDYLFTEEGSMLAGYGIEGVSYTIGDDGQIAWTDQILNNPDGYGYDTAYRIYALPPSILPSWYHYDREFLMMGKDEIDAYDIWGSDTELDDWNMPAVTMTREEGNEYAKYYADIESYMNECTLKFITGTMDVNGADWDTYVKTLEGMNLDKCTELQQAALDRYIAR